MRGVTTSIKLEGNGVICLIPAFSNNAICFSIPFPVFRSSSFLRWTCVQTLVLLWSLTWGRQGSIECSTVLSWRKGLLKQSRVDSWSHQTDLVCIDASHVTFRSTFFLVHFSCLYLISIFFFWGRLAGRCIRSKPIRQSAIICTHLAS